MPDAREVEFCEISETRSVVDEIAADLTDRQMAAFARAIGRLEKHGWTLNGGYFSNVKASKLKLREYRLTLDRVEYRVLFSEEPGEVFVMLRGYKEKRNDIPKGALESAEERLNAWRASRIELLRRNEGITKRVKR